MTFLIIDYSINCFLYLNLRIHLHFTGLHVNIKTNSANLNKRVFIATKIFNLKKRCTNLYCTSWFLAKVSRIHKTKEFLHKQKRIEIHNWRHILSKSSKDFLFTNLFAFVEFFIKTHKCNSLMNNKSIISQRSQNNLKIASLTYLMD